MTSFWSSSLRIDFKEVLTVQYALSRLGLKTGESTSRLRLLPIALICLQYALKFDVSVGYGSLSTVTVTVTDIYMSMKEEEERGAPSLQNEDPTPQDGWEKPTVQSDC